jgi:hypothetical protein
MTYDRKRGAGLVAGPASWFNTKFTFIIASWVHTDFRGRTFYSAPRSTY